MSSHYKRAANAPRHAVKKARHAADPTAPMSLHLSFGAQHTPPSVSAQQATALALTATMIASATTPAFAGWNIDMAQVKGNVTISRRDDADTGKTTITVSVTDDNGDSVDSSDGIQETDDDSVTIRDSRYDDDGTHSAPDDSEPVSPETQQTPEEPAQADPTIPENITTFEAPEDSFEVAAADPAEDSSDDMTYLTPTPVVTWPDTTETDETTDPETDETAQTDSAQISETPAESAVPASPAASADSTAPKEDKDEVVTYQSKDPVQVLTKTTLDAIKHIIKIVNNVKDSTLNVTLENVNINVYQRDMDDPDDPDNKAAVSISGAGDTTITLKGDNILRSGAGHAGLEHNAKDDEGNDNGKLTITGSGQNHNEGALNATGGVYAAGIGGGSGHGSGDLEISGGTIEKALGSVGGAGIGGGGSSNGHAGDATNVTISGGTIEKALGDGAGIGGGGGDHSATTVTISGGTIKNAQGHHGAGIGGGSHFTSGDTTVTISGGTIENAQSSYNGAGIGGGGYAYGDTTVTISGGTIKNAQGRYGGAGIGGGYWASGDTTVTISGGTIENAQGGTLAAGIGDGGYKMSSTTTVTISGGTITAQSGNGDSYNHHGGAGIGGSMDPGSLGSGDTIVTISGGKITAIGVGDSGSVAIGQPGHSHSNTKVSISNKDAPLDLEARLEREDDDPPIVGTDQTLEDIVHFGGENNAIVKLITGVKDGAPGTVRKILRYTPPKSAPTPEAVVITPAGVQGIWFTTLRGDGIVINPDVKDTALVYATLRYGAAMHTTLGTLRQLRAQGITHITFRTLLCTTTLSLDDFLAQHTTEDDATVVTVRHNGKAAELSVG